MSRSRGGFTLLEVTAYIGLASGLTLMLLSAETAAARQTDIDVCLLLLDGEADRIAHVFARDVRGAARVEIEAGGAALRIVPGDRGEAGTAVRYRLAGRAPREGLDRSGSLQALVREEAAGGAGRPLSLHVASLSFRREGTAVAAEWTLGSEVRGRSLERRARAVAAPRAPANGGAP